MFGPFLEMAGELGVGHDINAVDLSDGCEVVEDVLDHGLAGDGQERLGLREGCLLYTSCLMSAIADFG